MDQVARSRALRAIRHDALAFAQARGDDTQAVLITAELDLSIYGVVARVDHEHEPLVLVDADGLIADQQATMGCSAAQTDAGVQARHQAAVPIVEDRPYADRA